MASFKIKHQLQGDLKICAGACPIVFCFRAGSLDAGDAPASFEAKPMENLILWMNSFT